MAVIESTQAPAPQSFGRAVIVTWAGLQAGDTGAPIALAPFNDRSVQVEGTFGGASVQVQGSINGVDFRSLTDPQGNDLSFVAGKIEAVSELVALIRPLVAAGDGTTTIDVSLILKKA